MKLYKKFIAYRYLWSSNRSLNHQGYYSERMSWKLKDQVQFPLWMFVPSQVHCITARNFWSSIQSRTERTKEKKYLYVLLVTVVLSELVQPSTLWGPGYVRSHLGTIELNIKRLFSLWDKTLNWIKDLFLLIFFI